MSPAIVTSGNNVTVTYTVTASEAVTGFTPPAALGLSATGGATAIQQGAVNPSGPTNLDANKSQTFTYTYKIAAGTPPTGVTFSVPQRTSGTGVGSSGAVTWPLATAHNVIAVPALTMEVKVVESPTGALVDNVATLDGIDKVGPNYCYIIANGSGANTDVDVLLKVAEDGSVTRIGLPGTTKAKSLVLSPDKTLLYTTDQDPTVGAGSDRFGTLDLATGVFTPINRLASTANLLEGFLPGNVAANFAVADVVGMSFNPLDGKLYAVARRENTTLNNTLLDLLFVIDPATGQHVEDAFGAGQDYLPIRTDLLTIPLYDIDDITFDTATGTLYAIASDSIADLGLSDRLVTINPATGAVADIGRITRSDTLANLDNVEGLTYYPGGGLHITTGGVTGETTPANTYWVLDATTAKAAFFDFTVGEGTHITDPAGNVYDFEGVACISDDVVIHATDNAVTSLKGAIGDLVWADINGDQTYDPAFTVTDGRIDFNTDGTANDNDDGILGSVRVIDGWLDMNGDNLITSADNGTFQGKTVIGGYLDMDGDTSGTILAPDATDDGSLLAESGIAGVRVYIDDGDGVFEWTDANGNGLWDAGEGEQWTLTAASGEYWLYGLADATYTVRYDNNTAPSGYVPTTSLTQSAIISTGTRVVETADFGLQPGLPPNLDSTIGDLVWVDRNENGIFDTGDEAIDQVTVRLYRDTNGDGLLDPDGADNTVGTSDDEIVIGATVTDAAGKYLFAGLNSGNYLVQVDQTDSDFPAGLALAGSSPAQPNPEAVSLGVKEDKLDVDFAYNYTASIGDFVWYDNNGNAAHDVGENGVPNANVMLFEDTNRNGLFDGDVDVQIDSTRTFFTVIDGKLDINADGSITEADDGVFMDYAIIDGLVDVNAMNGVTEADDLASLGGYPVVDGYLDIDRDGVTAGDTGDDLAAGEYLFDNLPAGTYFVQVYEQSVKPEGCLTGCSYFQLPTTDTMQKVVLNPNQAYLDADFGFKQGSTIEGSIFHDINHDSVFEPTQPGAPEPGLAGITVWIDADADGALDWVDGDSDGQWDEGEGEQWTETDANGDYKFFVTEIGSYLITYDVNDPVILAGKLAPTTPTALNTIITVLGEQKIDIDFGLDNTGVIGDLIFGDLGTTGTYDGAATDPGLANVVVELYADTDGDGSFDPAIDGYVATTVTDASGYYLFPGLPDGAFFTRVLPASIPLAWQTTPTVDPASPMDGVGLASVINGGAVLTMDFGYPPQAPGSLTGTVYNDGGNTATGNGEFDYAILDGKIDLNRDGVISAADAGAYGGYTIIAGLVDWDSSGIVDTADTSPVGEYLNGFMVKNGCFDIDRDGTAAETTDDAIAGFPIITGKLDINRDGVVDGNDDGAFRGYTVIDGLVDVNGGGVGETDDLADLAGYPIVNGYFDINRNSTTGEAADVGGVAGDTAIAGVTINLYDSTGAWIASTVTDTNGFYRFDGLRPGSYTVEEVDPPGAYSVTDKELDTSDPAYNQIPAAVTAGATSAGNDFLDDGAYLAPISGQVRNDTDSNGNLADTDTGIPGVTIRLFSDLDGDGTTPLLSIIDGKIDMNGDGAITSADDGALFGVKILDGQVDANNDGAITAADDLSSLNGIQVIDGLLDVVPAGNTADDDGTIGTEPLVATTVTDSSGYYTFPNLTFGDYVVVETDPANAVSTNDKTNDPLGPFGTDNQVAVALSYGGESGIDFLDSITGTVSGFLYKDVNGDGVYTAGTDTPLSGVDVLIEDSTGNLFTVTTDVNGNWTATVPPGTTTASVVVTDPQFTAVFPGGYVQTDGTNPTTVNAVANTNTSMGNDGFFSPVGTASIAGQVRFDTDGDGDLNDPDAGIPGVVIELYLDEDGDGLLDAGEPLVKTTATDTSGSYSFPNLAFANYLVKEINPAGATSTMDKDANSPANGYDLIGVNLTSGGAVTQQDFLDTGLTFYSISGTVWNDTDQTGGFSTGDTPVSGVTVAVYADLDGDGLLSPDEIAAGPSAFTTTDASGNYTLTGLPNGNYVVLETDPVGVASVTDADGTSVNGANQIAVTINNASVADRDFLDTGAAPVAIGDYLWLDEDSDGVQDAGEAGIPNVRVELYDASGNTPLGTTYTDANGGYLFTNASAGVTYSVKVATDGTGALPAGLASNPTHDLNGIATPHVTTVTALVSSEGNFSADFGYNWASTGDVTNPQSGATGAIGDRLWIDANNNGIQDAGEAGLGGVSVALTTAGPDGLFGTADDVTAATTTTAADGNYIFDGLAAGAYQVIVNGGTTPAGYTLTTNGDPDGTADNKTTAPIVLGPGDVYVNADFGYVPNAGYAIGNVVFFDLDGDGFFEPNGADSNAGATADNEYGIAGVTVALYNSTGAVIATAITDAAGTYSFPGLADGTYSVKITDTANVLAGLIHTTGTANTDNYSQALPYAVTLSGDSVNYADFGFAPPDNTPTSTGTGVIGDTIFLDRNGMGGQDLDGADNILGTADDEPGLEGVTVYLYDATGATLLATTVTDENGHYVFAGLDNFTYQIRVDTATLPGSPSDPLTNSSDPDGGAASQSQVILTGGAPNLDQDFGYWDTTTPNTITGTLWNDLDAGGVLETGETGRYAGVTVVLRDSNADIVATAVTDASGNYTFSGLPNGAYTVDVTDTANILDGLWHSLGTANTDDNSQTDPYTVTLTGNQTANADFGYYGTPAALGDFVWNDLDQDGLQDMDEIGIANAVVTLTVTWPDSSTTVFKTTTDVNGHYTFGNLLLDENYDGLGTGEPTYTLVSTMPAGGYTTPSPVDAGGNDATDSDNHAGQTATVTQGAANNTYDFGYYQSDLYTISGKVLADTTNSGVIDVPGDTPLAGVVVQLYEKNGSTPLATTVTDINGNYAFAGWPDGKYRVVETNPSGVSSVTDSDGLGNGADEIAVEVKGADMPGNNFLDASGAYLGSISGHVFEDGGFALPGDGDFGGSPTDTPIVNMVVSLYNDLDNDGVADPNEYMGQTVTDSGGTGLYTFSNLTAGNYLVRLDDPAAGNHVTDADGTGNGADQIAETLTAGEVVTDRDFLVDGTLVYSISGSVLNDADRSGAISPADTPIAGVTVTLYSDTNENGILDADVDLLIAVSNEEGIYAFENLPAGSYLVVETDPAGAVSVTDSGEEDPNTDDNTIHVTITNADSSDNDFLDAAPTYVIGDRVWLDEDADGIQDAGESGLANVTVGLYTSDGTVLLATTLTDAEGNYLFTGLAAGTYTVKVDTTSMAAGLVANPTFDKDLTLDHMTTATVGTGEGVFDADFGYNWAPTADVTGNQNTGAIGDRVWIDANGNGVQDPGEPGMGGVEVTLVNAGADGIFGTGDDTTATTTTAADGSYVFDGLSAGAYQVSVTDGATGYLQTGDPDQPGLACTACDAATTAPILLAPGDVYVNADFGFQPTANSGTVSGTLWFDADADATGPAGTPPGTPVDTTEPVIAGVTVALVKDSNGNGMWDAGETIIATTVTDASGNYAFTGLPATGAEDYLVWVNDTANVLAGLVPTYDNNGTGTPNLSTVSDLTTGGNALQDFGYTAAGQTATTGLIGDTIFLDRNNNGTPDAGEGLEGVTVGHYQSDGTTLITTTVTDENGHYAFGGLGAGTYVVKVDTTTLPGTAGQLSNTKDPDTVSPGDNQSSVTLTVGQINLAQDFGYQNLANPNTITGTIWSDTNRDGVLSGETGVFAGVTVVLRDSNGDIVATAVTDALGNYTFSGLPDGTYTVDVTDEANVLGGLWHSTGTLGADNNSQTDPYTVAVSGGNTYPADFGYYGTPAALGDWVWADDGDGIQEKESGEMGLAGVVVQLTITWPGSATPTVVQTVTDANGYYSFDNLLLDENLDGVGTGEPTYSISIPPANRPGTPSLTEQGTAATDSNDPAGTAATLIESFFDVTYDFGFYNTDAKTATISGVVYDDDGLGAAGNGGFDVSDAPVSGVEVSAYLDFNGDGIPQPIELVGTTVTAADGTYSFPNLFNGSYLVVETNPSGATSVTDADGIANGADLIAVPLTGNDVAGRNFLDDGTTTTSMSGHVYDDGGFGAAGDGAFGGSPDDAPITGVIVQLYRDLDGDGVADANELVDTTATDATGAYSFPNLPSGSYLVIETDPVGATSTLDTDNANPPATATDNKVAVTLGSSPSTGNDFLDDSTSPYTYAVSGTVYNDANLDGVINTPATGDTPISGVTVVLYADLNNNGIYDPADQLIATQTTDSSGNYSFPNIPSGEYLVIERDPAGFVSITDSGEPDPLNNSNVIAVTVNNDSTGNNFLDRATGTIGNYVWLDENGDGVQDAGEAGIANLTVALTGTDASGNAVSVTTVTDANGGYVFDHLPPSNGTGYTITVTPAAGLVPTYNEDTGTTSPDHATTVVLAAGANHLTSDFGYNWAPSTDVVGGTGTGAIGDRIWNDADGDGIQDPGEAGLANVQVWLLTDDNGDGVYGGAGDSPALTVATDAAGSYVFDGLPAGAYAVQVNTATLPAGFNTAPSADPDGVLDSVTGPIVLAPGDVYVNADFGYKLDTDNNPSTGADAQGGSRIGDLVFFDADGDGAFDVGTDYGIAGVAVKLLDNAGNVIATTTTDSAGSYSFPGLPAGAYTVAVSDTANVLGGLDQSADPDGGALSPSYSLTVDGSTAYDTVDFGYTPSDNTPTITGTGVIGDTIYLDRSGAGGQDLDGADNMLGTADDEPGLAGVVVQLWDGAGTTLLATAVTDQNGNYTFAGVDATATYTVKVATSTLPNGGAGMVNTGDPNGGGDSQSVVDLSTGAINLDQDFGYQAPAGSDNTITGTIWKDLNADGVLDADGADNIPGNGDDETGIGGVTVVLRDSDGDVVGTAITDASGNYSFPGLPDGTYTVDVVDENNVLNGLWHSLGAAGTDDNSQSDPYSVSLTGGQTGNADFGYYGIPAAALGDRVWNDANGNGVQDSGEAGLANVAVTLTVVYPDGTVASVTALTDASGHYAFENLLVDENYDGAGATYGVGGEEPQHVISVAAPAGYLPSPPNQAGEDQDSEDPAGELAYPVESFFDVFYDFGFTQLAQVSGHLFLDSNGDGDQDPGEPNLPNVNVVVTKSDNTQVTVSTDADGNWVATVPAGATTADVDQSDPEFPAGALQTAGTDPTSVTAVAGVNTFTDDDGYYAAAGPTTVSGHLFVDSNGDGDQDPGEPNLANVDVRITPSSGPAFTVATDANGDWIAVVPAGATTADVVEADPDFPAGYTQTAGIDPTSVTAVANTNTSAGVDGYQPPAGDEPATVYGHLFVDENGNGAQEAGEPNLANVDVMVIDGSGTQVVTTDANGNWVAVVAPGSVTADVDQSDTDFPAGATQTAGTDPTTVTAVAGTAVSAGDDGYYVAPVNAIGDRVWLDEDGDGAQDAGEAGLANVVVELRDLAGALIASTVTDAEGNYLFSGMGDGVYVVKVVASSLASGLAVNPTGDRDGLLDSQTVVNVSGGGVVDDADFGYNWAPSTDVVGGTGTGAIGDRIWNDADGDGIQDPGEAGLANVQVRLLTDDNGDGVYGGAGDSPALTAATDAAGRYVFDGLAAGAYVVQVNTATLPAGFNTAPSADPDGVLD
ncbi:MAG TPA: SdrD B-like domain-containing protein, partial [Verrucomicrobiota bacterium]|nr:SdrD B-like domain-containing protein [Verrucomicrobiota bacterium]